MRPSKYTIASGLTPRLRLDCVWENPAAPPIAIDGLALCGALRGHADL